MSRVYEVEGDVHAALGRLARERGAVMSYDGRVGLVQWDGAPEPTDRDVQDAIAAIEAEAPAKTIEERLEALEEAEATRT